ncbi:MAG: lysophospholipid acyltransferase family protein, partial [Bacteroidales bacterium]|nr:lysophospholipid acyltransferase family protein [Bacteroidales bacterium]
MDVENADDILKKSNHSKIIFNAIPKILIQFSKFEQKKKQELDTESSSISFIDAVLNELQINFEIDDEELKRIPSKGPFITVSNHPLGGIDVLLLIKIISKIRPDYKFIVNDLFYEIEALRENTIPIKIESKNESKNPNLAELKKAFTHLNKGGALGIFPAGVISPYHFSFNSISDKVWNNSTISLIKKANVPIIPIYFQGNNSWFIHVLGGIHPIFHPMSKTSGIIKKNAKNLRIRIGNQLSVAEQDEFDEMDMFGRYLRSRTYALGKSIEVKNFFLPKFKWKSKKVENIIDPVPPELVIQEMEQIDKKHHLFDSGDFSVYCVPSLEIPNVLTEIGRLREITFREVGEGTNKSVDLDEYDLYYSQLIVWDWKEKKIAGAYRVGMGQEIMNQYGVQGFYIHSLFKIEKEFFPILNETIELGRSFIIKEYQRKPLSLFLLWKGITYFLLKHREYRYLVGPASISNVFSKFSKSLIVNFFKTNYYNDDLAKLLKPRKKFKVRKIKNVDQKLFLEIAKDMKRLDKLIFEIENEHGIPVLLKKYIKLNAKLIGFNVDPDFNNSLDGLIILDIFDVPFDILKSLSKEIQDDSILERFNVD